MRFDADSNIYSGSSAENSGAAAAAGIGPRNSSASHAGFAALPLIVIVALVLRIGFAWYNAERNPKQALAVIPFLFESGNIAYSLAIGHGFGSPFRVNTGATAWMTPLYPLLLSGIFRIFGANTFASYMAAAGFNIVCSALTCIPLYYAGKKIESVRLGAAAAWIWAIFPNAILLPFESMWDACLAALLAATMLWATLALRRSKRRRDWCAYGLLWGVTLMTNGTMVLLLPFLFAWLAFSQIPMHGEPITRMKSGVARPALALAIVMLCCVPWTVRNYEVFHAFVPLRSVLGLQLWMGNSEHAQDIWLGTYHPIFNQDERDHYVDVGEIAYMHEKRQLAIDYMKTHVGREAHLIWRRSVAFWAGGTPYPVQGFLRRESLWFRYVLLFNLVAAVGALVGIIVLLRRRSQCSLPLAVFPIVFPWAYYLTLVEPRYRLPIDPAIILLVAVAILAPLKTVTGDPSAMKAEAGRR